MGTSKISIRCSVAFSVVIMACGVMLARGSARGQGIRTYDAFATRATVVADGVISPGEWDEANIAGGGAWDELRTPFGTDPDTDNNRFRIQWDDTNLYILWESDHQDFLDQNDFGGPNPNISFGEDNLNIYLDPRSDGELANNVPNNEIDGYQFAFNTYKNSAGGALISTDADRAGVGFYTEAHVDSPFGNQGQWPAGGNLVEGPGLGEGSGITVAQNNQNGVGGLAEIIWPWDAFTAAAEIDDGAGGMKTTGLNHAHGPPQGDTWLFNMSMITDDSANFLPIWNWHNDSSFAVHGGVGHGEITFVGHGHPHGEDINNDGFVDGLDLGILLGNFNQNAGPEGGELNGTDPVDGLDLGILLAAWAPPLPVGASAIPEPCAVHLLLIATGCHLASRRRPAVVRSASSG